MGTNFYLQARPPCPTCNRAFTDKHIGKSGGGWCFTLHVYPEEGINHFADWVIALMQPGVKIVDEYGKSITFLDMLNIITRANAAASPHPPESAQWYRENQAEPGPYGLARSKIGSGCIGHGEGAYDYCIGDFS